MITVTGGKWTTYRLMAEQAIDTAVATGDSSSRPTSSRRLASAPAPPCSVPASALPHALSGCGMQHTRTPLLDARSPMARQRSGQRC